MTTRAATPKAMRPPIQRKNYWHDGGSPIRTGSCHNVGVALKVIGEKVYVDVGMYLTAALSFHVI